MRQETSSQMFARSLNIPRIRTFTSEALKQEKGNNEVQYFDKQLVVIVVHYVNEKPQNILFAA